MSDDIKEVTEKVGRKLQIALIKALYTQINTNPSEVSASTLAVAERMLARWNLGVIELPEDDELTPEEQDMMNEFKNLSMGLDSDSFETVQ